MGGPIPTKMVSGPPIVVALVPMFDLSTAMVEIRPPALRSMAGRHIANAASAMVAGEAIIAAESRTIMAGVTFRCGNGSRLPLIRHIRPAN